MVDGKHVSYESLGLETEWLDGLSLKQLLLDGFKLTDCYGKLKRNAALSVNIYKHTPAVGPSRCIHVYLTTNVINYLH